MALFGDQTSANRSRMLAQQLLAQGARTPRNVGEGLLSIGNSLAGALMARQADARQQESRERGMSALQKAYMAQAGKPDRLLTGGTSANPGAMAGGTGGTAIGGTSSQGGNPALLNALMQANPDLAARYMFSELTRGPGPKETFTLKEGVDPKTGKPAHFMFGNHGNVRPFTGYTPMDDDLMSLEALEQRRQLVPRTNVSTTVESAPQIGTIPQGFQVTRDPESGAYRMEAIPGGPADIEAQEKAAKAEKREASTAQAAGVMVEDIDRALAMINSANFPVTGMGSLLSFAPGTPQHDLAGLLDTVRANIGFDKLQAMREASPTGGALGQVSNFENRLMQATIGNLEQSQSKEQLVYNLKRVRRMKELVVNGTGKEGESPIGSMVSEMGAVDIVKYIEGRGGEDVLTPEEVQAFDARLTALGR